MDVQKILKWADELILAKTGAHLNSLEQAILTGVWNSQKYKEIAHEYHCTEANVKRVAGNLWKLISETLNEKVDKKNFRATVERLYFSNSNVVDFVKSKFYDSRISICGESCHSDETPKSRSPTTTNPDNIQPKKNHDLTDAPKPHNLYNRTNELATLKQWILVENSPIVTITGLSGIGKTTLARQLVEEIKDNFQGVIWRNHSKFTTLKSLQTNLIEFLSQEQKTKYSSILDYLRSRSFPGGETHRCLIILDDFQETLTTGEFVSTYIPEYKNYGKLIKEIAHSPHNSCLLLLSWEKPTEIANLETENCHCHTLQLQGLGKSATELLKLKKLTDEDKWLELINLYSGNPLWLNIIASTIQDLFNGRVSQFLSYSSLFLGDLEPILHEHYRRLSESEKLIMLWLANQDFGGNICNKPPEFSGNNVFLGAIQSLRKRGLIKKNVSKEGSLFTLEPVIKQYVKNQSNS